MIEVPLDKARRIGRRPCGHCFRGRWQSMKQRLLGAGRAVTVTKVGDGKLPVWKLPIIGMEISDLQY